jgi:hypothetical protein
MHEILTERIDPADFEQVRRVDGFAAIAAEHPAYLTDESKFSCRPFDHLFFPGNEAELAAVMKEMARRRIRVTVAGARTGLAGGCAPSEGALISLFLCKSSSASNEVLEARLPALVSASKGEALRRMPSLSDVLAARGKEILRVTAADLDLNEAELGLSGSCTQVVKVFPPPPKQGGRKVEGIEPAAAAQEIANFLKSEGFL